MPRKAIDWPQIKRAFVSTGAPVSDIARSYGVAPGTIRGRARREGWSRPADHDGAAGAVRRTGKSATSGSDSGTAQAQALTRMLGIVNRLADELEQQLDAGAGSQAPSLDKKGAAGILNSLTGTLEKLMALEKTIAARQSARAEKHGDKMRPNDAWDEIQRRLARLAASAGAGTVPESTAGGDR